MKNSYKVFLIGLLFALIGEPIAAQPSVKHTIPKGGKKISSELFGLFFEDINYSADGGLYAELIQNRSFEYSPNDRREWHPFSFWEYITPGYSYGNINVETNTPVHPNNPHYIVLHVEHTGDNGVGVKNTGFGGIVVREGENYNLSMFARQLSDSPLTLSVSLQSPKGKILADSVFSTSSKEWKKYTAELTATESNDTASLVILVKTKGNLAMDVVSLFPER
ncbi:MAG TPA: carbohydrate binding domain-containing protein, partial [Prolixibacteraceae bacterium]|nr:carbohydrate binding domain-containing protein [Prolixibacteraceae bacterium]